MKGNRRNLKIYHFICCCFFSGKEVIRFMHGAQKCSVIDSTPNDRIESRLTDAGWLHVKEDRPRDVLPGPGEFKECGEVVVTAHHREALGHVTVRPDPVLQAVELPAGIAHLYSGLAKVNGDHLPLVMYGKWLVDWSSEGLG